MGENMSENIDIKQGASSVAQIQSLISPLAFGQFQRVTHRASVSDLFKSGQEPGLYVLAFADGAFYAGKTKDIKQRFCSHARDHGDIDFLALKSLPVHLHDAEEKPLIQMLKGQGIRMRNIQFISNPDTPREIDVLISPELQGKWLESGLGPDQEHRQVNDEQRYRYARKHQKLTGEPIYPDLCKFLATYARTGLIAPKMTEMCYWCMTVWPSPSAYVGNRTNCEYARLNIGGCEVMTIGKDWVYEGNHPGPFFVFHVALSTFNELTQSMQKYFKEQHPGVLILKHRYETMGEDQISIAAFGFDMAHKLINDACVQKAIRLGNLGLMRKRACLYSQNHCYDIADCIFS
jgi:hypothetical protein